MGGALTPGGALGAVRLNPDLLRVVPYVPGKSAKDVQAEFGLAEVVKLASNENPCGPSPLAIAAARKALADAHLYPGGADLALRARIASEANPAWEARWVLTGSGATDILRMLSLAFAAGGEVLVPEITFPMYRTCAAMFGAAVRTVPMRSDWGIDLPALAAAVTAETRLVHICTPNNPTGLALRRPEVEAFLGEMPPWVVVAFDESYRAFDASPEPIDAARYVACDRPVVVVRSFSKAAGLANLRIGYVLGPPDLLAYLARAQLPFHIGAAACAAALASLDDHVFHARGRRLVLAERAFLQAQLLQRGLAALPSQTNFVLALGLPAPADQVVDALQRRGVIVRNMAPWGLPRALRVSVGTRDQNLRFLAALDRALETAHQ